MLGLTPGSMLSFTQQDRLGCHDFWAGMKTTTQQAFCDPQHIPSAEREENFCQTCLAGNQLA